MNYKELIKYLRVLKKICLTYMDSLNYQPKDIVTLFHIGECTGKMTDAIDRAFFVYDAISYSQYNKLRKWLNAFVYDKIEKIVDFKYRQ